MVKKLKKRVEKMFAAPKLPNFRRWRWVINLLTTPPIMLALLEIIREVIHKM